MSGTRALLVTAVVVLGGVVALALCAYARQLAGGLYITGLSREVPWGLYIGQMTFMVGIAASAVMVVLPHYLHHQDGFARLTLVGELVSICAVVTCLLFVFVDMGQPARVFNVLLYPSVRSLMFWDLVALGGYLAINLVLWRAAVFAARMDVPPPRWLRPLAVVSIPWAFAIHTVTALLYAGLAARPGWLTALLAPRFLASAFASGPALLILVAMLLRQLTPFDVGRAAIDKIATIVTYALLAHVFFFLLEIFTAMYGAAPATSAHFHHVLAGPLAAFSQTAWLAAAGALVVLLVPALRRRDGLLAAACAAVVGSVWMDKGYAFIVAGFTPDAFGRSPGYAPTGPELVITAGVYSVGLLLLLLLGRATVAATSRGSYARCTR